MVKFVLDITVHSVCLDIRTSVTIMFALYERSINKSMIQLLVRVLSIWKNTLNLKILGSDIVHHFCSVRNIRVKKTNIFQTEDRDVHTLVQFGLSLSFSLSPTL